MIASLFNFHPQRASWYHAREASWERAELATGSVAMLFFHIFFRPELSRNVVMLTRKNGADVWESTA